MQPPPPAQLVRRLRVRGLQQRFHPSFVHRSTRVRARRRDVTAVDERIDLTYVRAVHPAATEREPKHVDSALSRKLILLVRLNRFWQ